MYYPFTNFADMTALSSDDYLLLLTLLLVFLLVFFYAIPSIILNWILFTKANKPGWAAIIPIYSTYVMAKITKRHTIGFLAVGMTILSYASGFASIINPTFDSIDKAFSYGSGVIILILTIIFFTKYTKSAGRVLIYLFLPIIGIFFTKDAQYEDSVISVEK